MEDKKIRNKIIAISGQPVTGKGTNVKAIIKKLKQEGYKEENIHISSTGDSFRRYFNSIIGMIQNLDSKEKAKEFGENTEIKELLSNEEYRKALAETVAKLKKSGIDLRNFNIEQANNLEEFKKMRKIVDTLIDQGMARKGIEINKEEKPNDIWIIDSRLAFHNIPEAFSVRLTSKPEVAGKRLFDDKTRGKEDNKYASVEEAIEARERRRLGENERYLRRYGVDLDDEDNYDLIIDTSYSTIDDISNSILECSDLYYKNKYFPKNWASPKVFLPLQIERETLGKASYSMDEMIESMKKYGYISSMPIRIVEFNGIKGIVEGHHRNFGAALNGITLIPYTVMSKDNKEAENFLKGATASILHGHEWFLGENFSYNEIYPGIYDRLREEKGEKHEQRRKSKKEDEER